MAEISISTINVADGRELGDTPRVFTQRPNRQNPRPGDTLIVYCDLPSAGTVMLQELAQTVSEGYQHAPGGIATALRLAMKLANERLLNHNLQADRAVRGSLTCAVVSGNTAVLAQAGPAVAYARSQNGAFERIAPPARTPLFGSGGLEVYVANFAWRMGDSFVLSGLSSMSVDGKVGEDLIDACMGKGDGRMIAGYLNANVKVGFVTGLAFSLGAAVSQPVAEPPLAVSGLTSTARASGTQMPSATGTVTARTIADFGTPQRSPGFDRRDARERPTRVLEGGVETMRLALGRVGSWIGRAAGRASIADANRTPIKLGPEAERTQRILLVGVALLLPLVVAATVSAFSLQLAGDGELRAARAQVLQKIQQAQSIFARDPGNAPGIINEATGLIRAYEARSPTDRSFDQSKAQLQSQLDSILRVRRVLATALPPFATASVRRIAAFDNGVYVLDTSTNTVDQFVLNVTRNGFTGQPIRIAPQSSTPLASIRDISWATPRNNRWPSTDGVLMIGPDSAHVFSTSSGRLTTLKLPATLPQTVAGDIYAGLFYQLDTASGQVWRMRPQGESVAVSQYLTQPLAALQDGIDLAVDGGLFVLRKPGSDPAVVRLLQGRVSTFTLAGLPEPLRQPVAIASSTADPEAGSVFVADSATGAIIEFSKTGDFIRQLRAANDELVGMQDLSYDFTSETFYAVSPRQLFVFKP